MERKIKTKVSPKEVYIDEELYPRSGYNWQTGYDYSQSMLVGVKFPPIILAMYRGKKYLVDGRHRIEAAKTAKIEKLDAIVYTGWSKKKIFLEAVQTNIAHGRSLSPYEKRKIILKLREMKLSEKDISKTVQIPLDKVESFVGERLVNAITGEQYDSSSTKDFARELGQAVIKSSVKHLAGETFEDEEFINLQISQKNLYDNDQVTLFKNVRTLLLKGLIDTGDEDVMKLITEVKQLLKKY